MADRGSFGNNYNTGINPNNTFQKLSQAISNNIHKISSNTAKMQLLLDQGGSSSDAYDKLQDLHHYTKNLVGETNKNLKELDTLPSSNIAEQKLQKNSLVSEFASALSNFQKIQRLEREKESKSINKPRNTFPDDSNPFGDKPSSGFTGRDEQRKQKVMEVDVSDMDLEMVRDQEESMNKLESDISDVNQIFKDLAMIIHEQGDVVDSIAAHTESAAIDVERGTEQLRHAKTSAISMRKKKLCLAITFVIILVIIIIILATTLGKKS